MDENRRCKCISYHDREQEGWDGHVGFVPNYLKEIGFDGVCTIEEFRPEYYAMSHEDNVKKAAEVTRDFVQKYFG